MADDRTKKIPKFQSKRSKFVDTHSTHETRTEIAQAKCHEDSSNVTIKPMKTHNKTEVKGAAYKNKSRLLSKQDHYIDPLSQRSEGHHSAKPSRRPNLEPHGLVRPSLEVRVRSFGTSRGLLREAICLAVGALLCIRRVRKNNPGERQRLIRHKSPQTSSGTERKHDAERLPSINFCGQLERCRKKVHLAL